MHPLSASSMRRLAVLSVAGLLAACGESGAPGNVPTSANVLATRPSPQLYAATASRQSPNCPYNRRNSFAAACAAGSACFRSSNGHRLRPYCFAVAGIS